MLVADVIIFAFEVFEIYDEKIFLSRAYLAWFFGRGQRACPRGHPPGEKLIRSYRPSYHNL